MGDKTATPSLQTKVAGTSPEPAASGAEEKRIQQKQGGHHMPPHPDDGPPLDDTDRGTDKIIKPVAQEKRVGKRQSQS